MSQSGVRLRKSELLFDLIQVQLFPSVFFGVFCDAREAMTAEMLGRLFTINFSEQQETRNLETPIVSFWRHLLLECEGRMFV